MPQTGFRGVAQQRTVARLPSSLKSQIHNLDRNKTYILSTCCYTIRMDNTLLLHNADS